MRIRRPLWFNIDPALPPGGGGAPPEPAPGDPPAAPQPGGEGDPLPQMWHESLPETWRDDYLTVLPDDLKDAGKSALERVPSPAVLLTNYVEAQKKIRAGLPPEDVPYLPKDATPEQIAEYRTKMDIPESADKYEIALDQGLTLGDDDREAYADVFNVAHAANLPTTVVSQLVNAHLQSEQRQVEQIALRDQEQAAETTQQLKKVWGSGDYQKNLGLAQMFFNDLPEGVSMEDITSARLPDGTALFNNPSVVQWFVSKQRELNPLATVVPTGDGGNGLQAMNDEIAALEKRMRDDRDNWYKDNAAQSRYQELLNAREQLNKRRA